MPRDGDFRELMVAVFPNRFSQDWELSLSTILPRGGSTKVLLERVAGSQRNLSFVSSFFGWFLLFSHFPKYVRTSEIIMR